MWWATITFRQKLPKEERGDNLPLEVRGAYSNYSDIVWNEAQAIESYNVVNAEAFAHCRLLAQGTIEKSIIRGRRTSNSGNVRYDFDRFFFLGVILTF